MANLDTIARPYAQAIFDLGLEGDKLQEWSQLLKTMALIADDSNMKAVLINPSVSKEQLVDLFKDIMGDQIDQEAQNLLNELANRKRLGILPAISHVYDICLAEHERKIDVDVVSAFPIDEVRLKQLEGQLQRYLNRQVNMRFSIDRELLGGVVIYAGDQVIDGSLRGKLNRLSERLCS